MALDWPVAAIRQIRGGSTRPAFFMRIASDPILRLWAGVGDFDQVPVDNVEDEEGAVWSGLGELIGIPELEDLINGAASRIEFSLAGIMVTGQMVTDSSEFAEQLRSARANIGLMLLGSDLQPVPSSGMHWLGEYYADVLSVAADKSGEQEVRSITLSVGSLLTGRRRPQNSYWTDPDQKRRHPTDRGCEQVAALNERVTINWPR